VYIKTDQLDGETDLKPRTEIDLFKQMNLAQIRNYEVVFNFKKNKLDEFEGKVREIPQNCESEEERKLLLEERRQYSLDEGKES
jgi:hypothetical protein